MDLDAKQCLGASLSSRHSFDLVFNNVYLLMLRQCYESRSRRKGSNADLFVTNGAMFSIYEDRAVENHKAFMQHVELDPDIKEHSK